MQLQNRTRKNKFNCITLKLESWSSQLKNMLWWVWCDSWGFHVNKSREKTKSKNVLFDLSVLSVFPAPEYDSAVIFVIDVIIYYFLWLLFIRIVVSRKTLIALKAEEVEYFHSWSIIKHQLTSQGQYKWLDFISQHFIFYLQLCPRPLTSTWV